MMPQTATTVMLPVTALVANDYNPNEMTEAQFTELVAEVAHLGHLPKPLIVRPNGTGYVIVDGEHGWRAAVKHGLTEIPCEIINVDDFEARRQTYKRNQHGTHHPVRLGQMFQQMMATRNLSQRALAHEIEVSEGSIRNALLYAEAAILRNGYAGKRKVAIETLTVRQVRAYVALPPAIGNLWLDCEASLPALYLYKTEREFELAGVESEHTEDLAAYYARLDQTGLVSFLKSMWSAEAFRKGMQQITEWYRWERRWCLCGLTQEDLRPYTRHYFGGAWQVRDVSAMDIALSTILEGAPAAGTKPRFHLTPDEFDTVLQNTRSIGEFHQHLHALVTAKTGVAPDGNQEKLQRAELEIAKPIYLEGSRLPIAHQYALWLARGWTTNKSKVEYCPSIALDDAKREIAQWDRIDCEARESVEAAVDRHLQRYYDRATTQLEVDTLTEAEMADTIAQRMPIYDTEQPEDQQAIEAMAVTLLRLTRNELLCLYKYSQYLEHIKMLNILTEVLAGASRS